MNRSTLQLIVKISELGSFTKAGLELNMTQPAVSRAVNMLEAELGVTLLIRNRRQGVMLTDIGERVVRLFRGILDGYEKVDQEAAREKGLETGTVRIGAFPVASTYFVPKLLSQIANSYPNIKFEILEGTIAEIKEWIECRRIDVGFIIPPIDEFDAFHLHREELYAVFRNDHPLTAKTVIQAADLLDQSLIVCTAGYESPVMGWFDRSGESIKAKYSLYNNMTTLQFIQEGMGISVMAELSLMNLPDNMEIRRLDPPGYRDIYLAVSSFDESSIAAKMFIETALRLFRSPADGAVADKRNLPAGNETEERQPDHKI
ncbi:LysR family transcriptional regulator [Cohnella zeiphila]|uniref:LysR family transcriptional regulator n=1 Tax=Cohnella zeiphila TaxID=2761120 RepID=A0A7X0SQB1_9BACL|nr:LysR family transcriptional regulator [Cohnella zeiphila]MBB6734192.1 LysR family transcriptional regulator [Cohnella zeiphila]